MEIAKLLVESGADIHLKSIFGLRALNYACWSNAIEIVQMLVDNGADVNIGNHVLSPLVCAVLVDGLEIVQILISRGVDVNKCHRTGCPPVVFVLYRLNLGIARDSRHQGLRPIDRKRMRIVEVLFAAGASRSLVQTMSKNTEIFNII